jgi:hypothetical protein
MTIPAFPLTWPAGWKRTGTAGRSSAKFGTTKRSASKQRLTIAEAVARVRETLDRMGIHDDDLVISTNLKLRLDGFPMSAQPEPADPGAAVYWRQRNSPMRCMAIDQYDRVADNIAAIAATLEAMRSIERHGGAAILERAFTGFTALEAPTHVDWQSVLGVGPGASMNDVRDAYRRLRSHHHPDRGGDPEAFKRVQEAYDAYIHEIGNQE